MKQVRVTFTDEEFDAIKQRKHKKNWHDFIMQLSHSVIIQSGSHDVEQYYHEEEAHPDV